MAKTSMKIKQQRKQKFSTREYSRCRICGRPHAYLRKYGICRICEVGFDHLAKIFGNSDGENFGREIFAGQGCNISGLLSQLSYKPVFTCVPCYYTHFPQKSKRNFCASRIIS